MLFMNVPCQWRTQDFFKGWGGGLTLHACHDRCRARPEIAGGGGGGGGDSDYFFFPDLKIFGSIFHTKKRFSDPKEGGLNHPTHTPPPPPPCIRACALPMHVHMSRIYVSVPVSFNNGFLQQQQKSKGCVFFGA